MSDADRIANLETIVRGLLQQVSDLRDEVAALRGDGRAPASEGATPPPDPLERRTTGTPVPTAARPAPTAASAPVPRRFARGAAATLDVEALLGRYGTIALATLVILMGAGAFLTWAIAHGLLGPVARVALGAIAAAAVAITGWRLRQRGTVRFGSTLLALALANVHLDAWGAGPRLHVLPSAVALGAAAAASAALAGLARRVGDEMLFDVGLGGALLAPFVITEGGGTAGELALYGWVVIAAGLLAMRERSWRVALLIGGVGCVAYAVAVDALAHAAAGWPARHVPSLFAVACAWSALVLAARELRGRIALAMLAVLVATQLAADANSTRVLGALLVGLAGTGTAYVALASGVMSPRWRALGAIALPLAFLATAVLALRRPTDADGVRMAVLWGAVSLGAAWAWTAERERHLVAGALATAVAILLAGHGHAEWCIGGLVAHAALFALVMRARSARALAGPVAIDLLIASLWAYARLAGRTPYGYPPFVTSASASAVVVVLGWWFFDRESRWLGAAGQTPLALAELLVVSPVLAAFVWIREELVGAFAADTATFLVIVYYAAAGVGAIRYGRRRTNGAARGIGLALAFYAAIKALMQAWGLANVALRVGSFVLVGLFMALVSYWYRAPDATPSPAPSSPATETP